MGTAGRCQWLLALPPVAWAPLGDPLARTTADAPTRTRPVGAGTPSDAPAARPGAGVVLCGRRGGLTQRRRRRYRLHGPRGRPAPALGARTSPMTSSASPRVGAGSTSTTVALCPRAYIARRPTAPVARHRLQRSISPRGGAGPAPNKTCASSPGAHSPRWATTYLVSRRLQRPTRRNARHGGSANLPLWQPPL